MVVPVSRVPRSWALNLHTWLQLGFALCLAVGAPGNRKVSWLRLRLGGVSTGVVVTVMVEMGSGPTVFTGREVASASV